MTLFEDLSKAGDIVQLKSPPKIRKWESKFGIEDKKEEITFVSPQLGAYTLAKANVYVKIIYQ